MHVAAEALFCQTNSAVKLWRRTREVNLCHVADHEAAAVYSVVFIERWRTSTGVMLASSLARRSAR